MSCAYILLAKEDRCVEFRNAWRFVFGALVEKYRTQICRTTERA